MSASTTVGTPAGPPWGTAAGADNPDGLLAELRRTRLIRWPDSDPVTHIERIGRRDGQPAGWPAWVPAPLTEAFGRIGIERPWIHQVEAAEHAWAGRSVVIATGTASGKSLAYQLPVLSSLLTDRRATALYLTPTKALAADQLRALRALDPPDVRAAPYDGDTPLDERDWVRSHSRFVFTNPDMLHRGILPAHDRWSSFLRRLKYVVVDECHAYRGVFGSQVAGVLRRLRRLCRKYRANPVFVLASATVSEPSAGAERLTGLTAVAVTDDASPRGATTFALWEPPLETTGPAASDSDNTDPDNSDSSNTDSGGGGAGENGAPVRRSAVVETSEMLADLVLADARTLAFVRSRRSAEVVAMSARRVVSQIAPALGDRVAAYRAGYLAEERRDVERDLRAGDLLGVAATNALELGVDVTGLDAVILSGYPGRLASLWQQAGRAGRAGRDALVVMIAKDDPLDTYLVHHPEAIFAAPIEATVLDPTNPYVLGPQLCCAAAELPLTDDDVELFGGDPARRALDALTGNGFLRRRPNGWYWTSRERPDADIRGSGGDPVAVVETSTGRLLGTVDAGAAHTTVHTGAVYVHQGEVYVVDDLELEEDSGAGSTALVHAENPDWTTHARELTDVEIVSVDRERVAGPLRLGLATVDVTSQVVSYLRRRLPGGEVIDETPLDLPPRQLRTTAVFFTLESAALEAAGLTPPDLPGALHAAEHAAIGLLPLVASCDRWDIGGLSTARHPDTDLPTVFVYDGYRGGAGFAERGFTAVQPWLTATREAIDRCACDVGCPSCVQSPKCGNGNEPLNKSAARTLLDLAISHLADVPDNRRSA